MSSNATEVNQKATENIMIYPSGLLMAKVIGLDVKANKMSYTKHYYIGSERVSAKTGTVERLGIFSDDLMATHMPGLSTTEINNKIKNVSNTAVIDANTMVSGVYTKFELTKALGVKTVDGREPASFNHVRGLLNIFYFHPDHLGSSSYITNQDGTASQHMEYLPFGETMVDEHTNSFSSPFKFNGKEYDEETGNYYYGARYYDPKISIWLSVDPSAEKYPSWSPYNYCLNNPIRVIDPDGRDVIILGNSAGASGVGHQAVLIGNEKDGWNYISKDGAAKSGGAYGESRYVNIHFESLEEFKNSAHNFEVVKGTNHSEVGGTENPKMNFKLDKDGNKIQRYDQAFYIDTDDNDYAAYVAGWDEAHADYCLTGSDCSDIPTAVLSKMKTPEGKKLITGEGAPGALGEVPRVKQAWIEGSNKGIDYDSKVKPSSLKLQPGEVGKIEP